MKRQSHKGAPHHACGAQTRRRWRITLLMAAVMIFAPVCAGGMSLNLDSIAAKGKFLKFCVDAYRWGDRTFSSYDSAYVVPTGYKFTVRPLAEVWSETYRFRTFDNMQITLNGDEFLSAGFKVHFMAVSYGYNFSLTQRDKSSDFKNYSFGFSCNMFEAALNYRINKTGAVITHIEMDGETYKPNIRFNGLKTKTLTADLLYTFNYRHYSQAAVFGMSKIQRRSSGSAFVGFDYEHHRIDLDGTDFIEPEEDDYEPNADVKFDNYLLVGGYGYNIVMPHGWIAGVNNGLAMGMTIGHSTGYRSYPRLGVTNILRIGAGCNHPRWFVNFVLSSRVCLFRENDFKMNSHYLTASITAGYRFNLW